MNLQKTFEKALKHHTSGNVSMALPLYEKILDQDPSHADTLHLMGVIAYEKRELSKAERYINKALSIKPDCAVYFYNLGLVYAEQGFFTEALSSFKQSLIYQDDNSEAHYRAGLMHQNLKDYDNAILYYKKALDLNPDNEEIWNNLGNIALDLIRPDDALFYFQKALDINPDFPEAHNNLGVLYTKLDKRGEASHCFLKAIQLMPDLSETYTNLGNIHKKNHEYDQALLFYEKSLHINPDSIETYYCMADNLISLNKMDRAISCFKFILEKDPDYGQVYQQLVTIFANRCDWKTHDHYARGLKRLSEKAIADQKMSQESPFSSMGRYTDISYINRVTESWSKEIEKSVSQLNVHFSFDRANQKNKKINVGYLSNNFRNHPNAHLVSNLFKQHNKDSFNVFCYSYGIDDGSSYRKKIEQDCDRFIDIFGVGYVDAAEQIHQDGVDILIDLTGYTLGSMMEICALRPAPVQVRYLGFPGSMRASFFDYFITDKVMTPKDQQVHYTEKFVFMPNCYQVNSFHQEVSHIVYKSTDFGIPDESIVFCSFNTSYKIESVMFDVWMNILRQVPGSVLWLLKENEYMELNLKKEAVAAGIDSNRLIFSEKMSKKDHLARLILADIALDTRIVGGHITTSDALWAGVPVITLQGNHFISRAPSSILTHIGLSELITHTIEDYEKLAVNLARDKQKLVDLKQKVSKNKLNQPLFDTARFVKNYEQGLTEMWDIYQRGDEPKQIDVVESNS